MQSLLCASVHLAPDFIIKTFHWSEATRAKRCPVTSVTCPQPEVTSSIPNWEEAMKKLRFVVSLTTNDNDYQMEQAASAEETVRRLNVDVQILYAENDAIVQSQQLLKIIQSNSDAHPDGIIFEPVGGTAMPQVAKAAAAAGIGWVVLNREVDYISELRRSYKVPIFSVSSDHEEIGRIQGKQLAALLPNGGFVFLVQGPSESLAAKQRTIGPPATTCTCSET